MHHGRIGKLRLLTRCGPSLRFISRIPARARSSQSGENGSGENGTWLESPAVRRVRSVARSAEPARLSPPAMSHRDYLNGHGGSPLDEPCAEFLSHLFPWPGLTAVGQVNLFGVPRLRGLGRLRRVNAELRTTRNSEREMASIGHQYQIIDPPTMPTMGRMYNPRNPALVGTMRRHIGRTARCLAAGLA